MRLVRTLIDCDKEHLEPALPQELRELYDGDLHLGASTAARPLVVSNFVSTLDGVVSYGIDGKSGGSTISGSDPGDRFIMGLLRASVDAVIVGARTVQDASPQSLWTPEYTFADAKDLYAEYRVKSLDKAEYPLLVIVSASGKLDLERAVYRTPAMHAVVITTPPGKDELIRRGADSPSSVDIHALNSGDGVIAPMTILRLLQSQYGVKTLLHEGGPTLFGQFLAADAIDEFFLTLSPQIAGRTFDVMRPGVVHGVAFTPDSVPRFQMLSAKLMGAYLYLRYRKT